MAMSLQIKRYGIILHFSRKGKFLSISVYRYQIFAKPAMAWLVNGDQFIYLTGKVLGERI